MSTHTVHLIYFCCTSVSYSGTVEFRLKPHLTPSPSPLIRPGYIKHLEPGKNDLAPASHMAEVLVLRHIYPVPWFHCFWQFFVMAIGVVVVFHTPLSGLFPIIFHILLHGFNDFFFFFWPYF